MANRRGPEPRQELVSAAVRAPTSLPLRSYSQGTSIPLAHLVSHAHTQLVDGLSATPKSKSAYIGDKLVPKGKPSAVPKGMEKESWIV